MKNISDRRRGRLLRDLGRVAPDQKTWMERSKNEPEPKPQPSLIVIPRRMWHDKRGVLHIEIERAGK